MEEQILKIKEFWDDFRDTQSYSFRKEEYDYRRYILL